MSILNGSVGVIQINPASDATAPVLTGAATNVDGTQVTLSYSETLDNTSTPATGDFSFSPSKTISNVNVTGSTVVLTVSVAFGSGDTITVNYTAGSNPIQDEVGNDAANLTSESVTNNVSVTYSSEAQAVFDLLDSQPTTTIKGYMATLIDDLVANGDWAELDVFQVYAIDTEANALLDWKGNNNATNSSAVFTANESFSFSGSNYIDTGFNPTADGVNWTLTGASAGVYCLTNTDTSDQRYLMGTGTDVYTQRTVANRLDFEINGVVDQITSYPNGWPAQETIAYSLTSGTSTPYIGGASVGSGSGSAALTNNNYYVGKRNGSGTGITGSICLFFGGSDSIDQNNIHTAFETYLTSMGVI